MSITKTITAVISYFRLINTIKKLKACRARLWEEAPWTIQEINAAIQLIDLCKDFVADYEVGEIPAK